MEDDYKKKFGVSYEFDNDLAIVKEIEKNWQKWSKYCRTCGGNFGDDCVDCKEFDEITKCANSYQFKKNELKRKYNYDYDDCLWDKHFLFYKNLYFSLLF